MKGVIDQGYQRQIEENEGGNVLDQEFLKDLDEQRFGKDAVIVRQKRRVVETPPQHLIDAEQVLMNPHVGSTFGKNEQYDLKTTENLFEVRKESIELFEIPYAVTETDL